MITTHRLPTELAAEQSEEWVSGRRYLNMEELLAEWGTKEKREDREVALLER